MKESSTLSNSETFGINLRQYFFQLLKNITLKNLYGFYTDILSIKKIYKQDLVAWKIFRK